MKIQIQCSVTEQLMYLHNKDKTNAFYIYSDYTHIHLFQIKRPILHPAQSRCTASASVIPSLPLAQMSFLPPA